MIDACEGEAAVPLDGERTGFCAGQTPNRLRANSDAHDIAPIRLADEATRIEVGAVPRVGAGDYNVWNGGISATV